MMESWRVDRSLCVYSEAHPIDHAQKSRRNNHRASARPGDEAELAVAQQNGWRHGAERTVAGRNGVGFRLYEPVESVGSAGVHREVVHHVVEEKSCDASDVGAITIVQRIGAGDGVASGIDDGEMRGVVAFAEARDQLRSRCGIRGAATDVRRTGLDLFA